MHVPVLGMSSCNLGLVTTGSSDHGLHRTRTKCPAVLTRLLADPHSHAHADLTAGRHGESHRGFRLLIARLVATDDPYFSRKRQVILENTMYF